MKYYTEYKNHKSDLRGKKNVFDNTIYTLDIETSSYLFLNGTVINNNDYLNLTSKEQEDSEKNSCMYIWMLSINEDVYFGRTYLELKKFIQNIEKIVPERKIIFIHNLSFEFQFLQTEFNFKDVIARKKRKVMKCNLEDFNVEFRCSYMMSNSSLSKLPKLFNLPVKKMVGDLDYNKIRTPATILTKDELKYCENDCLVIYYYILSQLETYDNIDKIPLTSTGHVRRELKKRVLKDISYRSYVYKSINVDGNIYNKLIEAFAGGYTHSNWIYTDEILYDVTSWDFSSSYPYILVSYKFPSKEFKKCFIKKREEMSEKFAYLIVVKFKNIKSKYFNNFISQSKCRNIVGGKYDNGRIMEADEFEITLTDVDFYLILDSHNCEYEILEIYYSLYNYLHKDFIEFVLEKYVIKTTYKDVAEKYLEYQKEKNKFNALYGMSVTNNIRDEILYDYNFGWSEEKLSDKEILEKLENERKQSFLSFSYGVWVTAHARNNLLRNIMKLDEYVVYSDTDSIKLLSGYDKNVIDEYNLGVENRLKYVSNLMNIDYSKFEPTDIKGKKRLIGIFDSDGEYSEFITQGAKKYCYRDKKDGELHITVAGVPKTGVRALNKISDFKDTLVFEHKDTNKNILIYNDFQNSHEIEDFQGVKYNVIDKFGCCILPTTYVLGKSEEYANLISDFSSKRSIFKGGI